MEFLEPLRNYLASKETEMIEMLKDLVNQDSGTGYKEGVDAVADKLKAAYEGLDVKVEVIEQKEIGKQLVIKTKPEEEGGVVVLGHMDTVFPRGTAKERPFTVKGDWAYGPGVSDMKAGLTAMFWSLKAIFELGLDKDAPPITYVLNSDEETGSVGSRALIEKEGQKADYVLVAEPGRANGSVVTARKGVGFFVLTVKGRAAHAGGEPEKGINAIVDLADAALEIYQLNDFAKGTTFNPGVIEGGSVANAVPAHASMEIDLRIETMEEAEKAVKNLEQIAAKQHIPGAKRTLTGEVNRPPMVKLKESQDLYLTACKIAEELGFDLPEEKNGGGSDGNFTAALGIPTLDGLGPVGGGFHGVDEFLELKTFTLRTAMLAGLMLSLKK